MTAIWADGGVGRTIESRYRLVALVGAGASARVYLADDLRLKRQVAVKVLHPGLARDPLFLRRFAQEARTAAAFSHPHLVAVYDWGDDADGPYLVTEFLAGGSLRSLLATGARLSVSQAVKVGIEAASGLAAAHRRGMIHRDIKPANLLFDLGGRLRIGDFGLVRALSEAALTEPDGVVLGTVRYAAPERALPGTGDGRTDVYSLVLTLVESVTGEVPGAQGSGLDVLAARQLHDISIPEEFGPAAAILRRAGSAVPEDRPTAEEFTRGLEDATEHLSAPDRLPLAGILPGGLPAFGEATATLPPAGQDGSVDGATPEVVASGSGGEIGIFDVEALEEPSSDQGRAGLLADDDGSDRRRRADRRRERRERRGRRSPRRGLWLTGVALVLIAAGTTAAVMVSSVEPEGVPTALVEDFRGRPVAEVRTIADLHGWTLDEDPVRSDSFEAESVIRQSPEPGTELPEDSIISVDVVSGPYLVMTPWVVGYQIEQAEERLAARGFQVASREPVFDEVVPAGQVLVMTVDGEPLDGGLLREPGAEVELVFSAGPVPRSVPAVVGLTLEDAAGAVAAEQLNLVEAPDREFSETVPEGSVIAQTPEPGTQVDRGSDIEVVVSKGPDRRAVPNVIGMSIEDATSALEAVGLVRTGVSGGGNIVDSVSPRVGTLLKPGDGVELFAPR
ncbi:MAG TPA: PASTA domain-containing protein [Acidimicrobiales bacterium]|nr:PASTA domain-containing protein [Acidimicrobiales bacterium]